MGERRPVKRLRGGQKRSRGILSKGCRRSKRRGQGKRGGHGGPLDEGRALGVISPPPRWSDARNEGGWCEQAAAAAVEEVVLAEEAQAAA